MHPRRRHIAIYPHDKAVSTVTLSPDRNDRTQLRADTRVSLCPNSVKPEAVSRLDIVYGLGHRLIQAQLTGKGNQPLA
jgi:hypothetical protein